MEEACSPNWFDLPFELREMIIDVMDAKTRCTFAMCSKQCEKEVKESNNYLHTIEVSTIWKCISVQFYYENTYSSSRKVIFKNINDSKRIENQKNTLELLVEGDLEEEVARFVLEQMNKCRNSLRNVSINARDYNSYVPKINFKVFRKLEDIYMHFNNVAELSSIIGLDKVLRTDFVSTNFNFTFDQIMKFEGSEALIKSNQMNEENVKKYLKMWKNGEVHQNIKGMRIIIMNEKKLNIEDIIEGLDVQDFKSWRSQCEFTMKPKDKKNESRYILVKYKYFRSLELQWER